MAWSPQELRSIYNRTCGNCHLCHRKMYLTNYGKFGERGAWEVEHSVARARGGTDHGNNLYGAHISCNREKRDGSTRAATLAIAPVFVAGWMAQRSLVRGLTMGAVK